MELEKVKYFLIETICKKENKKELIKALQDGLCFVSGSCD